MALFDLDRRLPRLFHLANTNPKCGVEKRTRLELLSEQILDSLIVAGITGVTSYIAAGEAATLTGAAIGFTLAFLIKLKEYRKIK